MKQIRYILSLLSAILALAGCASKDEITNSTAAPDVASGAVVSSEAIVESPDDNYRTWYEIFVYSFCDSDGDGIGDLNGVTSKLDYLEELGINGIWLMPIHPSSSYHKYNVTDYYAIDPQYGTMEDFENFMAECEKRDIHVILDLVLNHSGSEHAWFKEAVSYLQGLEEGDIIIND